jgi:hypothetical protein
MPREFNLEGEWKAFQSNGWTVTFFLTQDFPLPPSPTDQRTKLSGSARAVHPDVGLIHADTVSGRVDRGPGAPGQQFILEVNWSNATGVCNGTFGLDNRLSGVTVDRDHPTNVASWASANPFATF